jgi:hypothetical protein
MFGSAKGFYDLSQYCRAYSGCGIFKAMQDEKGGKKDVTDIKRRHPK